MCAPDIFPALFACAQAAGGSTSALIGDYSEAMPTPTPMRTPATPAGEDVVMQVSPEAWALASDGDSRRALSNTSRVRSASDLKLL